MNVPSMVNLLRGGAAELDRLAPVAGNNGRVTAAQQLLYLVAANQDTRQSAAKVTGLAGPLKERLRRLLAAGVPVPALLTRYTSSWVRDRHRLGAGAVSAIAVAPDRSVIAASVDGRVLRWRPTAGAHGETVVELDHPATALAYDADRDAVAIGDQSGAVHWAELGGPVPDLPGPGTPPPGPVTLLPGPGHHDCRVRALVLAGGYVFSAGSDGRVLRWDPADPHDGPVLIAEPGPAVSALAAAGRDVLLADETGVIHRWSERTGGLDVVARYTRETQVPLITAMAVTASGDQLFSASFDGRVLRWPILPLPAVLPGPSAPPVPSARIEPSAPPESVTKPTPLPEPTGPADAVEPGLETAARPGGPADTGPRPPAGAEVVGSHNGRLWTLALTADDTLAVASSGDGMVLVWPADGTESPRRIIGSQDRAITALAATRDGTVVTGGRDGFLLNWWATAEPSGTVSSRSRRSADIHSLVVEPGGAAVLTGGRDGLHRWRLDDDSRLPEPERLSHLPVRDVVSLTGGTDLVAICGDELHHWALGDGTGRPLVRVVREAGFRYYRLAAVPGARSVVATRHNGDVERIDLDHDGGVRVLRLGWHRSGRARAVAVTPDGAWAITSSNGLEVYRWSTSVPGLPQPVGRHAARVTAITVSAGGSHVITGDEHGRITAWPLDQFGLSATLHPGEARSVVRAIVAAPDDRWIAAATDDGAIRVWRWPAEGEPVHSELIPVALPRNLGTVPGGLLAADRYGGLTRFDVEVAAEVETTAVLRDGPPEVVVVVDNWSLAILARSGRRVNHRRLVDRLADGRPVRGILVCPPLPPLHRLRQRARQSGLEVHDVSANRRDQRREIGDLLAAELRTGLPVVLYSTDDVLFDSVNGLVGDLVFESDID